MDDHNAFGMTGKGWDTGLTPDFKEAHRRAEAMEAHSEPAEKPAPLPTRS
jgi:hypothetical protein